jgi:hypothetical protein
MHSLIDIKAEQGWLTDSNQSRQRGTGPSPTRYCIEEMPDSELTQEAEMIISLKLIAAAVVLVI